MLPTDKSFSSAQQLMDAADEHTESEKEEMLQRHQANGLGGHKMAVAAHQLLQGGAAENVTVRLLKIEARTGQKTGGHWIARVEAHGTDGKWLGQYEEVGPTPYDAVLNVLEKLPLAIQLKAQKLG